MSAVSHNATVLVPPTDRNLVSEQKPVVQANAPDFRQGNKGFKDRVLGFLANIPILKNTAVVQAYTQQLARENTRAVHVFINALAQKYGPQAATRAVEVVGLRNGKVLTGKVMQALTAEAVKVKGAGDTKPLARQMVVRIWPYKSITSPGHVALAVKNGIGENGRLVPRANEKNTYMSWWPVESEDNDKKLEILTVPAAPDRSYAQDKRAEISKKAAQLLSENAAKPRPFQKPTQNGEWGTSASGKIFLPLAGNNFDRSTGQNAFRLFGLNEGLVTKEWQTAVDQNTRGEIGYQIISTSQNCAGMAERLLRAGGAEEFLSIPSNLIATDPDKVLAYTDRLQVEVHSWNIKEQDVAAFLNGSASATPSSKSAGPPAAPMLTTPLNDGKALSDRMESKATALQQKINALPPSEAKPYEALAQALSNCKAQNTNSYSGLVREAKGLVGAMHALATPNANGQTVALLQTANQVLDDIKQLMARSQG